MPFSNVPRPSRLMMDVMEGKLPYKDADKSIQSAVSMEFYRAAVYILEGETNEEKRKRLDNIPEYVKEYVTKEVARLIQVRKNSAI